MSIPDDDAALSNKMAEVFGDETLRHDYQPPEQGDASDGVRSEQQQRQQPDAATESDERHAAARDQTPQRGQPQRGQSRQQQQRPNQDANGDLVDGQGNVVAKAGREREFFERARGAEYAITQVRVENSQLKQRLSAFED